MEIIEQVVKIDEYNVFELKTIQNLGGEGEQRRLEDVACFTFVTKGSISVRTANDVFQVNIDESFLLQCGNYFIENQSEVKLIEIVHIYFHKNLIKEIIPTLDGFYTIKNVSGKIGANEVLEKFKESIIAYMKEETVFSKEIRILKIKELLLVLAKIKSSSSFNDFLNSLFAKNELDFRKAIENNLYSSISIKEMAFICGMSLASFKRKFNDIFNTSPALYLRNKKLEKAKQLLDNKELRIGEIAFESGFESISTFNRLFKKECEISPSEYRMSQNEQ